MPSLPSIQTVPHFDANPSFVVGRDHEGHWLAVETHGHAGGIFTSKDEAIRYAMFETDYRPDAVRLTPAPMEMKL